MSRSAYLRLVEAATTYPIDVATVRDEHLRVASGAEEDDYIDRILKAAIGMGERVSRRAFEPQTWELVRDALPGGTEPLVVPKPPLLEVVSVTYIDTAGDEQTLEEDTDFVVSAPVGEQASYGHLRPAHGTVWPMARCQPDAVTVRFVAGYARTATSPDESTVPTDLVQAILLVVGELYKQRSESVHTPNQSAAMVRGIDIFKDYRVY